MTYNLTGQTWKFNSTIDTTQDIRLGAVFISDETTYDNIRVSPLSGSLRYYVQLDSFVVYADGEWEEEEYRTITFTSANNVNSSSYAWLVANAEPVKIPTYTTTFVEMTAVADAIRDATGTSTGIEWPDGFVNKISNTKNEFMAQRATGTLSGVFSHSGVTSVGAYAFYSTSLTELNLPNVTNIGSSAFWYCTSLTTISLPALATVNAYAFGHCSNLASVILSAATYIGSCAFSYCSHMAVAQLPNVTSIMAYTFSNCYSLANVSLPLLSTISGYAFRGCSSLTTLSLPKLVSIIGTYAFSGCRTLTSLYLLNSQVATLSATNAFSSTPIAGYTTYTGGVYGSIYVPASLYSAYISATNWATYSSRFVSV